MAIDPESLLGTDSDERAEIYYRTGNALLGEIDARLSAGTPIQQLEAEVNKALVIACAARLSAGTSFQQLEAEVRQALAMPQPGTGWIARSLLHQACADAGELLLHQPKKVH